MRITCGSGKRRKGKVYMPPALGNGDLSFQIDYEGAGYEIGRVSVCMRMT